MSDALDLGPYLRLQASPVAFSQDGDWVPAENPAPVPALLLDLPESSAMLLSHGAYLSTEGSRLHVPVPHADGGPDCLRPYRPLDADGIVLHGSGNWDPSPFLGPGMRLAYLEPRLLETFPGTGAPAPSFDQEDPLQTMKLFRVWDARSLLTLRPGPLPDRRCTRVFGAYKAKDRFRQIGDRRGQNSFESYLEGVSKELPAGFMLTRLTVPRFSHQLHGSTTDRRDFYTQCAVSRERAHTNAVKPCFRLCDFVGLRAHQDYCDWVRSLPSSALGSSPSKARSALLCPSRTVHGCFSSLFQGDASGVEFATAAHVSFLEDQDILPPRGAGRVVARQPLSLHGPWAGVVIDDLFAVSAEAIATVPSEASESERIVRRAQQAYDKAGILGSPEKDTLGETVFAIAGAQIDSSPEAVSSGCVTVGSPVEKRLALSLVSLKVASCRVVSQELAAMLAGGWVSSLLFRRCGMAVLDSLFGLGSKEQFGEKGSPLVDLPAKARQELVLLAALAPLLATNVAATYLRKVVASDASLNKGAYTETSVSEHLSANLWLAADSKGFYTRLDSPLRASTVLSRSTRPSQMCLGLKVTRNPGARSLSGRSLTALLLAQVCPCSTPSFLKQASSVDLASMPAPPQPSTCQSLRCASGCFLCSSRTGSGVLC